MADLRYTKGLHEIGSGSWAYLLPDGGWGWSNSGLVTDGNHSMLVDTMFDLKTTREMLDSMGHASAAAQRIDILVNSHADGDHTWGNQLVPGARIIASAATAKEFSNVDPLKIHALVSNPQLYGEGVRYVAEWMGPDRFDFSNIVLAPPTEVFEQKMHLKVGDKDVHLINVGPAHTAGDTLVHVVQDKVLYTGDILFIGVHPAIWDGSIDGWIEACDRILTLDVDYIVPGHGPITDKNGVVIYKNYLQMLRREARLRFDAGIPVEEAAIDIALTAPFTDWLLPERVAGSVNFLYRQFGSPDTTDDMMTIFAMLARYAKAKDRERATAAGNGHAH
jgi:glyoxylase-like metal-dependent hydrolase (beta-lactamase superfamily II)